MSGQEPPGGMPRHNLVAVVTERVAIVTGDPAFDPAMAQADGERFSAMMRLASDRAAGSVVLTAMRAPDDAWLGGEVVPARHTKPATTPIGHYAPERQGWQFYREYVDDIELPLACERFDGIAGQMLEELQAESRRGRQYVDLRDPTTAAVRAQLRTQLVDSGLASRLLDARPADPDGAIAEIDDHTSVHIEVVPITSDAPQPPIAEQLGLTDMWGLNVVYRGLRLVRGTTSTRHEAGVVVAVSNRLLPRKWQYDPRTITEDDFLHIVDVPYSLKQVKAVEPAFSPRRCAVVRGPDPEMN